MFVSDITVVEVVVGAMLGQKAADSMNEVLSVAQSIEISSAIINIAKNLRSQMPTLKTADAIIAGTALFFQVPLISTDRHMERLARTVSKFKLINPSG